MPSSRSSSTMAPASAGTWRSLRPEAMTKKSAMRRQLGGAQHDDVVALLVGRDLHDPMRQLGGIGRDLDAILRIGQDRQLRQPRR